MKYCYDCHKNKEESEFISMRNTIIKSCRSCRDKNNEWYLKKREREGDASLNPKTITIKRRKEAVVRGNNVCSKCMKEKSLSEFKLYKQHGKNIGSSNMCLECRRLMWRLCKIKDYGLTKHQFFEMYEKQDKSCAICSTSLKINGTEKMRASTLCVDHCHETGRVRGLLCNSCNRGLGFLGESIDILYSAYQYLIAHSKPEELLENPEADNQQPS